MRYYFEKYTGHLRLAFEQKVLHWPYVNPIKMFGCPCYQANGELFAFLVTNGLVLTHLSSTDRETLSHRYRITPFQAAKKTVSHWIRLPVRGKSDIECLMPFVKKSYQAALQHATQAHSPTFLKPRSKPSGQRLLSVAGPL